MIGYDDFLDGYLATEVDENVQNHILKEVENVKNGINLNKLTEIVEDEVIIEKSMAVIEELIEELSTDCESETEQIEEYKWIDDLEEQQKISSQNFKILSEPEIDIILPFESDNLEIELTGREGQVQQEQQVTKSSSDTYYDAFECETVEDEFPCSIQLTEPNYSQLLETDTDSYVDICRICNNNYDLPSDDWLMCFGCGEAFHRICLKQKLKRVKCEMPLIYRSRLDGPDDDQNRITHAPWFCNNCVECFHCQKGKIELDDESKSQKLKESFASCRHCGKVTCLSCYNSESSFSNNNNSVQLSRFSDLKNYSCPSCLQCINCGLNAQIISNENRRKSISSLMNVKQSVILYDDLTLCRPCYLSKQVCATCPRCQQIYHSLPDHYDFGEAKFNSEFSLCPMISCDNCGSWTHCQCEGIDEKEYERLGSDKNSKFTCIQCKHQNEDEGKKSKKIVKISSETSPEISSEISSETSSGISSGISSEIFRIGNLMIKNDDKILFNFWSFVLPWKRKTYKLTFKSKKFILLQENEKIESDSIEKLTKKFVEKFKINRFNGLNCFKAINANFLLNSMKILTFLESRRSKKFEKLSNHLREKILIDEKFISARTRPLNENEFVKKIINQRRRNSLTKFDVTSTNQIVNTGKMTVKFLYSHYFHTLKSDLYKSINTTDVYSCGLALRPSAIAGFGLFATRPFQRNSLIIEYCGEMLTGESMVNKRDAYYNALGKRYRQSCYLFRLDEMKVLDATHKGNLSRFINHSCDPNCYSRVVQIDSAKKLLIFASKLIEPGEEIVYDYKFPDEDQKIPCLCGSEKCRKWMN